jgi:hypothetical protein
MRLTVEGFRVLFQRGSGGGLRELGRSRRIEVPWYISRESWRLEYDERGKALFERASSRRHSSTSRYRTLRGRRSVGGDLRDDYQG